MSDQSFESGDVVLSGPGAARRETIREAMLAAGRSRKRRRDLTKAGAVVLPLLLVGGVAAWLQARPASGVPVRIAEQTPPPMLPSELPPDVPHGLRVSLVETDPGIMDRVTLPSGGPSRIVYIDDRQLSLELALAGHDPGIIRTPTEVIVVAARELRAGAERR